MPKRGRGPFVWSYGVQTCVQRRDDLLPRTLASLKAGGFPSPRLFVDGASHRDALTLEDRFDLPVVNHDPYIRTFGNWVIALALLFIREPHADRFILFQDDFVTYRNLRAYLEQCPYQPKRYYNLYTMPKNTVKARDRGTSHGWFESNQRGLGAVALMFDRDAVFTLLTHLKMIERPVTVDRGLKNVDGGVVNALLTAGYREMCHLPSLVQHTGLKTSMKDFDRRHPPQPLADTFRGEDFDALDLLHGATTSVNGHAGNGASAYDTFPEWVRAALIADWEGEMEAIRRAIVEDEARLARAQGPERHRFSAAISDYQRRLKQTERNDPPYITQERRQQIESGIGIGGEGHVTR